MAQEDLHKTFVHAETYDTMYGIVKLEDITNATLLVVVTHDTDPHLPTFHIMV